MAKTTKSHRQDKAPAKLSRRRFLQAAGALTGAAALGNLSRPRTAQAVEDFQGYPDRCGILIDTTKCVGCRMCEFACAKENRLPEPSQAPATSTVYETKRRPSAQAVTVVNRHANPNQPGAFIFRKEQCMQCNEPACASACLVGALKKTPEGPVIYNESVCIGCRYCMIACPFDMLSYEYADPSTPAVKKCTGCQHRALDQGGCPACAEACPTKALLFGKRQELLTIARQRIFQRPELYVNHIYGEHEAGGTGVLYLASVPFEHLGLPTNLGTTPFGEYTRDFLLGVPLVLMIWPGLLAGINALIKRRERVADDEDAKEALK